MDLEWAIAAVIAALFAVSGAAKLPQGARFEEILQTTYGFREADARRFKKVVPLAELTCAVLLIIPELRGVGLLAAGGFLLPTLYVASTSYLAGRGGDCGCFGDLYHQRLGRGTILRLLAMLAALAIAFSVSLSRTSLSLAIPSEVAAGLIAVALVIGVAGLISGIRTFMAIHYSADGS
jgi:hypothetical protein